MSTSQDELTAAQPTRPAVSATDADYLRYRSVSTQAVVALILSIVSIVSIFFVGLVFLPVLGILFGVLARRAIKRQPEELAGSGLATAAIVICLFCLITGVSWAAWIYVTEVPDGYQRISFIELQPDKNRPDLPVSPEALTLDGQRVFIKGYIYPDDRGAEVRQFVLVPDMGTCCFGGQPKLTDMVEVTLKEPLTTSYSMIRKKLGGILRVDTRIKPVSGLNGVYYQLEADYLDGEFAE